MKSLFIIITLILLNACNAVSVPMKVITSFSRTFPAIKNPQWISANGIYQAVFKINSRKATATYDSEGSWLQTEISSAFNDIPDSIRAYIILNNKSQEMQYACRIVKNTGDTNYDIHMEKKEILFDQKGRFIKEVTNK